VILALAALLTGIHFFGCQERKVSMSENLESNTINRVIKRIQGVQNKVLASFFETTHAVFASIIAAVAISASTH
jgi:hypothetical protein